MNSDDQTTKPPILRMPEISRENLTLMRRMGVADERLNSIKDAYLRMEGFYRPEAPSDGFGHIELSPDELADPVRLEMEAWLAARKWYEADERTEFVNTGCADYYNATAVYLILQAAQLCCDGANPNIRRVLELAIEALPEGKAALE